MLNIQNNKFLTPSEVAILTENYRFTETRLPASPYSIESKALLCGEQCRQYLHTISPIFNSTSLMVTASLFGKRYSVLTMGAALYAMSRLQKGLNASIDNVTVESSYQEDLWLPRIGLVDAQVSVPISDREKWRDQILQSIFADNIAKVWAVLSTNAKVSNAVLWEHAAMYVHWFYETQFRQGASEFDIAYLEEDYQYIMLEAPGNIFGERRNPFTRYNTPKVMARGVDKPIRIRKTCCFYYLTSEEEHDYCISCPKMTT
ncbi:IucA/IucC family C-terminal-domain containing protein [Lysinibacillus sp. FSL W8-0992]|uniref:IucA/IucC family C-terminal-domain containing protein n=1 Tax=Lysinibacillus sp. FSL W8-0992 TaxID=2954643 RepID=UPI0030FC439D